MDASLRSKAEQLASEIAGQAETAEDLNGLMRMMMKAALERMLNSEMDVHLGRKTLATDGDAHEPLGPTANEAPVGPSSSTPRTNASSPGARIIGCESGTPPRERPLESRFSTSTT